MFDTQMQEFSKFEDVPSNLQNVNFTREMFPPDASVLQSLRLEKCMRFLPHLNDDGGFFVAILRKTGPVKVDERKKYFWNKKQELKVVKKSNKAKIDKLVSSVGEMSFLPDSELQEKVLKSKEYLGLDLPIENMYTFNKSYNKVRLVSKTLKNILHPGNHQLKIASTPGVEVLTANTMSCASANPFYLRGSSYHMVSSYVSKRVVLGVLSDIEQLLNSDQEDSIESVQLSPQMRDQLRSMEPGWFTFRFETEKFLLECPAYFSLKKTFLVLNEKKRNHYKCLLDL